MGNILYNDSLIRIEDESISLKHYYFPFVSKNILNTGIEKIESEVPTLANGKWRIWGTGTLIIWFPFDILRPIRNKIFVITYKNKRMKTGFTVKDSLKVEELLKEKKLLLE